MAQIREIAHEGAVGKYMDKSPELGLLILPTAPGQPSQFWHNKEYNRYYRTKKLAERHDVNNIDPWSYYQKKPLWDSKKHTIIYSCIAVLFVAMIVLGMRVGKLEINIK